MGHTSSKSTPSRRYLKDGALVIQKPGPLKSKSSGDLSRNATGKSGEGLLSQGSSHRRTKSALARSGSSDSLHLEDVPPSYGDTVFPGSSTQSSNHLAASGYSGQRQDQTPRGSNNPFVRANGSSSNLSQSHFAPPPPMGYIGSERERFEYLRTPLRKESYENALTQLRGYDTIILVDDSGSMGFNGRWQEARRALAKLADVAGDYDENGLDIYFLNDKSVLSNCKDSKSVMRLFDKVQPNGITPIGERLNTLLNSYLDELDKCKKADRPLPKPVNLLVLTDGAPTDDPQSVIEYTAKRLDRGNYLLNQVGIQFVQIGNDKTATQYLQQLDDDIATTGIRDIVDTTPYIGEVSSDMIIKIMLGGINRRQDKKVI